ncbi:MAG: hypothetical protein JRC60_05665 [Deltaproteobacteria bacterium]|nr:hypothetical protein [Deltaproteobacteria bacterium]
MNIERAAMRGKLAQAREKRRRLTSKFEALASAIRQGLNTALTEIEDIEIPQLSEMWGELEVCWGELLILRGDIERLEKELGN